MIVRDGRLGCAGLLCAAAVVLSACAGPSTRPAEADPALVKREALLQKQIALQQYFRRKKRLDDVAAPVLISGVAMCQSTRPITGAFVTNVYALDEDMREAARAALGLGDRPKILYVVDDTPAARAGLEPGDLLVSYAGQPVPGGKEAAKSFSELYEHATRAGEPLSIGLMRDGQRRSVELVPVNACDYGVRLVHRDTINAFADGDNVIITTGMMRFAEDDNELALVIAHELAHNTMGHIEKRKTNALGGLLLDILAASAGVDTQGAFTNVAANAYSKEFEQEADYVGLYFMALAGNEIGDAPYFWRRMAAEKPSAVRDHISATHPASPQRFVSMKQAIQEIRQKREAGQPLRPELKPAQRATGESPPEW